MDRDGNYEENTDDFFIADEVRNDFDCPECHETITTNEEEALQFLNGETL